MRFFGKGYFLSGYYGMNNTGDDALLLASLEGIYKFYSNDDISVGCYRSVTPTGFKKFSKNLSDPQGYKGENRLRNYWHSFISRCVVWGGGSVLHSYQDISIKRHMIKLSGKGVAVGVSVGPFESDDAKNECSKWLNECDFVGVRDKSSFNLAKSISPNANVRLTFDLAPSLLLNDGISLSEEVARKGICLCLCPVEEINIKSSTGRDERVKALAKILVEMYDNIGEPITLLDFNGHEVLGDSLVHDDLVRALPERVLVNHIEYQSDPIKVMNMMSSYRVVVSMRLHASIFSFLTRTPVISINYHKKCEGWCDQVGVPREYQIPLYKAVADGKAWSSEFSHLIVSALKSGFSKGFLMPVSTPENALELSLKNWSYDDK